MGSWDDSKWEKGDASWSLVRIGAVLCYSDLSILLRCWEKRKDMNMKIFFPCIELIYL